MKKGKLVLRYYTGTCTELTLDGVDILRDLPTRSVELSLRGRELPKLSVDLFVMDADIQCDEAEVLGIPEKNDDTPDKVQG